MEVQSSVVENYSFAGVDVDVGVNDKDALELNSIEEETFAKSDSDSEGGITIVFEKVNGEIENSITDILPTTNDTCAEIEAKNQLEKKVEQAKELQETTQIIEEIIEGVALNHRRGTIIRTISAIIR